MFYLFATSAEDKGVTTFETHHVFAGQSFLGHELFNESLRRGFAAASLAHVDDAGLWIGMRQYVVAHQIVHQQHRGGGDGFDRFEGEQIGVAWAGANEGDMGLMGLHGWSGFIE